MLSEVMERVWVEHGLVEGIVTLERHLPGRSFERRCVPVRIPYRREYEAVLRVDYNPNSREVTVMQASFNYTLNHIREDFWRMERGIAYRTPPLIPREHRDPLDAKALLMEPSSTRYADYSEKPKPIYGAKTTEKDGYSYQPQREGLYAPDRPSESEVIGTNFSIGENVESQSLEGFESVERWLTRLGKKSGSPNTRRVYLHHLAKFCDYLGMTPDGLVAERRRDLEDRDEVVRRRAEERLDRWFMELEKRSLSRNSCVLAYNAVRSFYKANYLQLVAEDAPSAWPKKNKPGLTREELGLLLKYAEKPLHRAYILCQAQSGLGVSDLLRLTWDDVKRQVENGSDHIHLRLLRGKEKQLGFFDTFFGRMATKALTEYLLTRRELEPSSRLFPCTARNVNNFLARLSGEAVLDWKVSSHDLRKYYATNLKLARVNDPAFNETLIEYWQGHSLGKVRGAYFVPPVEEQLRLYKIAQQRLEPPQTFYLSGRQKTFRYKSYNSQQSFND